MLHKHTHTHVNTHTPTLSLSPSLSLSLSLSPSPSLSLSLPSPSLSLSVACVYLMTAICPHRCAHLQSRQADEGGRPVRQHLLPCPRLAPPLPLPHLPQHLHLLCGVHGNGRTTTVTAGDRPAWRAFLGDRFRAWHQLYAEYVHWYVCVGRGVFVAVCSRFSDSRGSEF